jgi:dTDP-4-dehydrorhamnose reductase
VRIVVTGRHGQVVQSLIERAPEGVEIVPLGRPQLDLAGPRENIVAAVSAALPDVIISAAAYTSVDAAESQPELAFAVNEDGARAVALAAQQCGVPVLHLSTDYVFDGKKTSAYVEDDPTGPSGVYGASKLAGERAVLAEHQNSVVLRTAWVYSPFGSNFVKTMLRLAADRDEISVVSDQRGNPTSALDIADALLVVAANLLENADPSLRGIFHMVAAGDASWAEFAEAIFSESRDAGGPYASVRSVSSTEYPTAATRPVNSRLDPSRLAGVHGVRLPDWHSSLKVVIPRLVPADARREGRL